MKKVRIRPAAKLLLVAIATLWASLSQGQNRRDQAASFPVLETSIADIHAAFKSGKLTTRQLVQQYLDRIRAYDQQGPKINSIITLNSKALEEADALDAQYKKSGLVGPLHG
ncbi:MAG: Amidase, partial [Acidobacteria bacterium]|nr:Amidase [Acidobacteriota bacterium]